MEKVYLIGSTFDYIKFYLEGVVTNSDKAKSKAQEVREKGAVAIVKEVENASDTENFSFEDYCATRYDSNKSTKYGAKLKIGEDWIKIFFLGFDTNNKDYVYYELDGKLRRMLATEYLKNSIPTLESYNVPMLVVTKGYVKKFTYFDYISNVIVMRLSDLETPEIGVMLFLKIGDKHVIPFTTESSYSSMSKVDKCEKMIEILSDFKKIKGNIETK
ncbi:hypothetical protein D3C81_11240 [compost metagenome]